MIKAALHFLYKIVWQLVFTPQSFLHCDASKILRVEPSVSNAAHKVPAFLPGFVCGRGSITQELIVPIKPAGRFLPGIQLQLCDLAVTTLALLLFGLHIVGILVADAPFTNDNGYILLCRPDLAHDAAEIELIRPWL